MKRSSFSFSSLRMAVISLFLLLSGCVHRTISLPLVSVTTTRPPDMSQLENGEPIRATFCLDERPLPSGKTGDYPGRFEEVLVKAQKKHKVDYMRDVLIVSKYNNFLESLFHDSLFFTDCLTLTAVALRTKKSQVKPPSELKTRRLPGNREHFTRPQPQKEH